MAHPEFVETKDVKFLEMREIVHDGATALYIRGFVFHSALAVKNVEINSESGTPWVLVALTPTAPGRTGAFEVKVPLAQGQSEVLFGPQKDVIWPRRK